MSISSNADDIKRKGWQEKAGMKRFNEDAIPVAIEILEAFAKKALDASEHNFKFCKPLHYSTKEQGGRGAPVLPHGGRKPDLVPIHDLYANKKRVLYLDREGFYYPSYEFARRRDGQANPEDSEYVIEDSPTDMRTVADAIIKAYVLKKEYPYDIDSFSDYLVRHLNNI